MTERTIWRGGAHASPARRCARLAVAAALSLAISMPAFAADPKAGRKKAAMCQVCHGYDGIGTNPEVPHIAGESDIYLIRQLRAFRSGKRTHAQMSIIAKDLTDEDIANLAAYYSAIKITVELPKL